VVSTFQSRRSNSENRRRTSSGKLTENWFSASAMILSQVRYTMPVNFLPVQQILLGISELTQKDCYRGRGEMV
jgi:hypothetical protein